MHSNGTVLLITVCLIGWLAYQQPSGNPNIERTLPKSVGFEPKSTIDGHTVEGHRFSSETWESSDGVGVFLRREYCDSPHTAERVLRNSIKDATAILETKILRDKKKVVTGKRIVASFDKDSTPQRIIFWTDGEMFFSVECASFSHALLFEKMFPKL